MVKIQNPDYEGTSILEIIEKERPESKATT